MKIAQHSDIPLPPPAVTGQGASKSGAVANPARAAASVAVSVSHQARALEKADSHHPADMDTKKIEAVRVAIQDGTYKVDAEAIADRLLANAKETLSRHQR